MARFRGGAGGQAPLQLQLSTSASNLASVVEVYASGETEGGAASFPALSRPATPGVGSSSPVVSLSGVGTPLSTFRSSFTTSPSVPTLSEGSFNLPRRFYRAYAPGALGGLVLLPSTHILLYARASLGHTWSGHLIWEED